MPHEPTAPLDDPAVEDRVLEDAVFMTALLDTLIPPSEDGKLPGAGALGVGGDVAAAIASHDRAATEVTAALEAIREQAPDFATLDLPKRVEALQSVEAAHPAFIADVITPLYFAYYQHPVVLMGLGLPARPPFPGGYEIDATDPDLLDLLRSKASR